MLTLSGTPDFTPFVYYILLKLSVVYLCLRINDWFVCLMSLSALSRTYSIGKQDPYILLNKEIEL